MPRPLPGLDPADPGSLAVIHRAQARSFGLVPAEPTDATVMAQFPAFTPSYAGAELKLRPMVAVPETTRQPRLFSASTSVLPDVPPRASSLPATIPDAVLKAVLPAELARRAGDALEIKDVPLTDPENAPLPTAGGLDTGSEMTSAARLLGYMCGTRSEKGGSRSLLRDETFRIRAFTGTRRRAAEGGMEKVAASCGRCRRNRCTDRPCTRPV